MKIHDDSQRKAVAFLIVVGLVFALFIYLKFTDNSNPKASVLPAVAPVQPISDHTLDTPFKSPKAEAAYFEGIQAKRGDVYNDRDLLISKIKRMDPTADFTGNYSEGSDKPDDNFEAPDKYGSDFQIVGSRKHVKEVNYTYRPSTYFGSSKDFEFGLIIKTGKILCKTQGENFTSLFLSAVNLDPNTAFKDSTVVGDKKMVFEYETENNTINFVVTHK